MQEDFTEKDWSAIRALIKKFVVDQTTEVPIKGKIRPYHEINFPEGYSLKRTDDGIMIDLPPYKPEELTESKLRHIIRENVQKELAEINKLAEYEVYESKLAKIEELIEKKCSRLQRLDEDEDLKALTDGKKVKELKKDVKILERAKAKIEKALAKEAKKIKSIPKKEVIDEDEPLDEAELNEAPPSEDFDAINKATKELDPTVEKLLKNLEDMSKLNLEEESEDKTY
jgi:hypothetical protein